jgi:hypothetical protein
MFHAIRANLLRRLGQDEQAAQSLRRGSLPAPRARPSKPSCNAAAGSKIGPKNTLKVETRIRVHWDYE